MREAAWEMHPSYGLVSFHRISGGHGTRFFGSYHLQDLELALGKPEDTVDLSLAAGDDD